MKKLIVSLTALAVLAISPLVMGASVYFDDGLSHTINDSNYPLDWFFLDEIVANDPGTHVDLVDGGEVLWLYAYNNATITMTGGSCREYIGVNDNASITMTGGHAWDMLSVQDNASFTMSDGYAENVYASQNGTVTITGGRTTGGMIIGVPPGLAYDNSTITVTGGSSDGFALYDNSKITVTGGSIASLWPYGNSTATIYGGLIGYLQVHDNANVTMSQGSVDDLGVFDSATVNLAGGSVGNLLRLMVNGIIYLEGTGFQITDFDNNTTTLSKGDKLSDFATLVEYRPDGEIKDYYVGNITGTLADGSALNNSFMIFKIGEYAGTADIIIACDYEIVGDLDSNCKVNLADFAMMAANWMINCDADPTGPACVPK